MTVALKMAGYIKKLEWAIWLSQKSLQDMREGDWLNLREELYDFVYGEPIPSDFRRGEFFKKATRESIEEIQRELKSRFGYCFENYAGWKKNGSPTAAVLAIRPFDVSRAKIHLLAYPPDLLFHQTIQCEDLKAAVLLELANVIALSGVAMSQIQRCQCGRLFLLKMKPRPDRNFHCSHRCAVLAATRKYRGSQKEKLRQKDRARYEKKQKRKFGPKTKVGRKPRHALKT